MTETNLPSDVIAPGAVIGILGGGQLGRMFAKSAQRMGYDCIVYDPDKQAPAGQVAREHISAAYNDKQQLGVFAKSVDVVTTEFENIADVALSTLAEYAVPLRPDRQVFATVRNRYREKQLVGSCGLRSVAWRAVASKAELESAVTAIGEGGVLKVAEGGYDGKGQMRVERFRDAGKIWQELNTDLAVYEAWLDKMDEISVIVGRNGRGEEVNFEPSYNRHADGILEMSVVPIDMNAEVINRAVSIAKTLASALQVHGLLTVEMFVTEEGEVLVNEMAPRPHNSGHWTIEGAISSQFDLLLHMICNLPLPSTDRLFDVEMINLLGTEVDSWYDILRGEPSGKLHIYGKKETRAGRKMGHFTRLFPKSQ